MCKILLNKDDTNLIVIVTLFELSHASVHNGIWDVQVIQFSIQMCGFLHAGRSFPWFSLVLAKLFWYQCVQDCAIPAFTVTTKSICCPCGINIAVYGINYTWQSMSLTFQVVVWWKVKWHFKRPQLFYLWMKTSSVGMGLLDFSDFCLVLHLCGWQSHASEQRRP